MRFVFGLLLVANLALLMWGSWYKQPLVSYDFPDPRPDVAAEKLKRLSEPGAQLRARTPSQAPAARRSATERCYRLGPFATAERARSAVARVDSWGLRVEQITEFESLGTAFQVFLPPLASREAAEAKRRELNRLGFKDHAVISEEGMENAISLGLFAVEANARQRQRQLKAKGIAAAVQPVPNLRHVYWLAFLESERDERIGDVPLARFAEEPWGDGVSLRRAACPPAAAADAPAQVPPG